MRDRSPSLPPGSWRSPCGWAALALTAGSPVAVVALVLVQGMLAFGTGTALISRVLQSASGAPTLVSSFSTAAFNVGGALGPWLGGITIGAGFGFRSPLWVSALLMVLALGATAAWSAYDAPSGAERTGRSDPSRAVGKRDNDRDHRIGHH